jgi:nicotinamide mononucleotide (NMN) deamidase PncC
MAVVIPTFESLQPPVIDMHILNNLENDAHKSAYDLLIKLHTSGKDLQICTSESLTAGMIMSTLVDIPWGGYYKYGAFGVYDTNAKRVFNGVTAPNVYTHRCAKEMAVGILHNSNATLAISVSGNAMPLNKDIKMLGEVFIGCAGYIKNDNNTDSKEEESNETTIVYMTKSINACNMEESISKQCELWYKTINSNVKRTTYNPRDRTAFISKAIRYYTTIAALNFCREFIDLHELIVPQFVKERKISKDIPANKFNDTLKIQCENKCIKINTNERINVKEYILPLTSSNNIPKNGGKRKTKKCKIHK